MLLGHPKWEKSSVTDEDRIVLVEENYYCLPPLKTKDKVFPYRTVVEREDIIKLTKSTAKENKDGYCRIGVMLGMVWAKVMGLYVDIRNPFHCSFGIDLTSMEFIIGAAGQKNGYRVGNSVETDRQNEMLETQMADTIPIPIRLKHPAKSKRIVQYVINPVIWEEKQIEFTRLSFRPNVSPQVVDLLFVDGPTLVFSDVLVRSTRTKELVFSIKEIYPDATLRKY